MRIVSLACSNTEIVCALGCAHMLVGVDDHSDFPVDVVAALPKVGPDLDIDVDKVATLKPDLVLATLTVPGHEQVVARLEEAGL
ncbi:MAG: ABC transporter substrate-binding protein, partial [Gemmatimonadales bacterium]|nr:ABC transporter substrate-binding protein [Gemmatimonadales bacterium]